MAARKTPTPVLVRLETARRRSWWANPTAKSAAVTFVVAVAVAAGGVWGFTALWRHVIDLQEFRLVPGEQDVRDLSGRPLADKTWIDLDNLKAYWMSESGDPSGVLRQPTSLFASRLTEKVYLAFMQLPWVLSKGPGAAPAVLIRRRFPNALEIRLDLRKPSFLVADPKHRYLLDDEGVVLHPYLYRAPRELSARPTLRFLFDPGVPEFGKRWDDEGICGGMHLVRVLEENQVLAAVPMAEFRIAQAPRGSVGYTRMITLIPRQGGEILWGSPAYPGKIPSPAEAAPEEKLRNLIERLRHYKSVLPQYIIDVRFKIPTARPKEN